MFVLNLLFAVMAPCLAQDRAQETVSATNPTAPCRFAIALPEMDGPLTLGIFSPEGKLTRLLYHEAPIDSIPAGLNGLLVSWDGKDDAGLPVPPGIYHARGLVHGKLMVTALPFSDWEAAWRSSHLQGTNDLFSASLPPVIPTISSSNQITVMAAKDALFENRPLLTIAAFFAKDQIIVTAEGLPILSIPVEPYLLLPPPTEGPIITLHAGDHPGTAELILISSGRKTSYLLSGLDQLVPLDAGALPMPPEIFIPDSASLETGKPRP